MNRTVSVTRERLVPAGPAAVWAVISDPSMQERLDSRCQLASASGDAGSLGSEFTLMVRGIRLRYVVVEADPGALWVANVDRSGKHAATQRGELRPSGPDTLLAWTVTAPTGLVTGRLVRQSCARELPRWLAAVEREVLASIR